MPAECDDIAIGASRCDRQSVAPFAHYPGASSCIAGLGGTEPPPFPAYVFRSEPIVCDEAILHFTLRLEALEAEGQILLLEVLNRSAAAGGTWAQLTVEGVHLSTIAANAGLWTVEVPAHKNVLYALAGYIHDEGAMAASNLQITVNGKPAELAFGSDDIDFAPEDGEPVDAAGPTGLAARTQMSGTKLPSFARPSSQPWSARQCDEAEFLAARAALGKSWAGTLNPWDWAEPIALQILQCYQALVPQARILAAGHRANALQFALMQRGYLITMLHLKDDEHCQFLNVGEQLAALAAEWPGHREELTAAVTFAHIRPGLLPKEYCRAYDIAWWIAPQALRFSEAETMIETILAGLRPGGLAVIVLPYATTARKSGADPSAFDRAHIERLALHAISYGHKVAQLLFGDSAALGGSGLSSIPYALIIRSGR